MSDRPALHPYGWDVAWRQAFDALAFRDSEPGRVVRVDRGECDAYTAGGPCRVISDSTRAQGVVAPATGDWVAITNVGEGGPRLAAVLPRRHTLVRRDPGERVVEQVLVANVDRVAIVHGLDRPLPPGRLERLLTMAWDSGAQPLVILTKADLPDLYDARGVAAALAGDAPIYEVSRVDGRGVIDLRREVGVGRTMALVGESGAGKSNLLNLLVAEAVQATGKVRDRDAKGRHTTVARQMHLVPGGGAVVDTPGMRAVGLWASRETLHRVFADIEDLARSCRFANCGHASEPQCAVQDAVESGDVDRRRLLRYRALDAEITALDLRGRAPQGQRPDRPRRR